MSNNFISGEPWASGQVVTATKLLKAVQEALVDPSYAGALAALLQSPLDDLLRSPLAPRGYLNGLTLGNNTTDANNDIDIAVGVAKSDDNTQLMSLAAGLTKRTDAAWALGTGNGGMDTGSKPNDGTLHVWLISNGTLVDVLFSISATAPTLPSGYTTKRRIGAVLTDGSGNIRPFFQQGNEFRLKTRVVNRDYVAVTTTAALQGLTIPAGLSLQAVIQVLHTQGAFLLVTSPEEVDTLPSAASGGLIDVGSNNQNIGIEMRVFTDTSRQIRLRLSNGSSTTYVATKGWIDTRGRDT